MNPPKSLADLEAQYDDAFARKDVAACTDLLIQMWRLEEAEASEEAHDA